LMRSSVHWRACSAGSISFARVSLSLKPILADAPFSRQNLVETILLYYAETVAEQFGGTHQLAPGVGSCFNARAYDSFHFRANL